MGKAFDDDVNSKLRRIARELLESRFDGKQRALAKGLGVTASYVSDFLSGKRGAGLDLLSGLGQHAPLELLTILGIDPRVVASLWQELEAGEREAMRKAVPEELRRAARAAVELTGCTPAQVARAVQRALEAHGVREGYDADWWLTKVRYFLTSESESGLRPSARFKLTEGEK